MVNPVIRKVESMKSARAQGKIILSIDLWPLVQVSEDTENAQLSRSTLDLVTSAQTKCSKRSCVPK